MGIIISARVFLSTHHRFKLDRFSTDSAAATPTPHEAESFESEPLGVPELEIFQCFQRHRAPLITWLGANESRRSLIFDKVLRCVTVSSSNSPHHSVSTASGPPKDPAKPQTTTSPCVPDTACNQSDRDPQVIQRPRGCFWFFCPAMAESRRPLHRGKVHAEAANVRYQPFLFGLTGPAFIWSI